MSSNMFFTSGSTGQQVLAPSPASTFIESLLDPSNTHAHKIERLLTIQRIQDIAALFPGGHINPAHDFSRQAGLRHLNTWNGPQIYQDVAMWMAFVGPRKYRQYLLDGDSMHAMAINTTKELCYQTHQWHSILKTRSNNNLVNPGFMASKSPAMPSMPSETTGVPQGQQSGSHSATTGPRTYIPAVSYNAKLKDLLEQEDNRWRGLVVDYSQYKAYRAAYISLNNETVNPVVDLPEHDRTLQEHIRGLYEAILDMDEVIDNPILRQYKKRKTGDQEEDVQFVDPVAVTRVKELTSIEIEILCWEILEHAWFHQQGKFDIPLWFQQSNKNGKKPGMCSSLEDRLDKCKVALRQSKNCVKQMLMIDFAKRLAFDPDKEVKRKVDNKRVNLKRDEQNRAGRYAKEAGLVIINEEDRSITSADGNTIAAMHPPTTRMAMEMSKKSNKAHPSNESEQMPANGLLNPGVFQPSQMGGGPSFAPGQYAVTYSQASQQPHTWGVSQQMPDPVIMGLPVNPDEMGNQLNNHR